MASAQQPVVKIEHDWYMPLGCPSFLRRVGREFKTMIKSEQLGYWHRKFTREREQERIWLP